LRRCSGVKYSFCLCLSSVSSQRNKRDEI
jgi:hypothetical protein